MSTAETRVPVRDAMDTGKQLLAVNDLRVSFNTEDGVLQAVDGVDL